MDLYFTLFVLLVALAVAAGGMLLLVGYIDTVPMSFAMGWRWAVPTLLVPVLGPIYFCFKHWSDCSKAGKQLMAGVVLVAVAMGSLYGIGPWFAARALAGAAGA